MTMYEVRCDVTLRASDPLSADAVSDLVEVVVDELDRLTGDASVSTDGVGHEVTFVLEVVVDGTDELEAFHQGFSAIRAALHAAGVGTPGLAVPTRIRPTVRDLLEA